MYSLYNIQSTITTIPCGDTLENACQSFVLANKICNIKQYNSTTYNVSPGIYSFDGIDAFGTFINKTITINYQQFSTDSTNSYTSVVFDLSGATITLFNVSRNTMLDSSAISVYGITFINGYQNQSSLLYSQGAIGNYTFDSCVFENVLSQANMVSGGDLISNGGAISILKPNEYFVPTTIYLNIIGCTYQNTNSTGINGGFIYVGDSVCVYLNIDQGSFNNFYGGVGALIYFGSINPFVKDQPFKLTNSIVSKGAREAAFYLSISSTISNVTFTQNYGGIGISITSDNSCANGPDSSDRNNGNNGSGNHNKGLSSGQKAGISIGVVGGFII